MSARIGIGAGLALLLGLAVWAALPSSASPSSAERSGAGLGVAPVLPAMPPPTAAAAPAANVAPPAADGDVKARVDACLAAQAQVTARRASRGAPTAPGEPTDGAVVARACAPLFHEAACRQAHVDFDTPPPEARASTLLRACEQAYCPLLPAPKPSACDPAKVPADGMETFTAWAELRAASLRHDIGEAEAARAFPSR